MKRYKRYKKRAIKCREGFKRMEKIGRPKVGEFFLGTKKNPNLIGTKNIYNSGYN